MTRFRAVALSCLLAVAPGLALAQSPDAAAERARLANERIQAEAERQAREAAAESSNQVAVAAPGSTQPASRPSQPEGSAAQTRPAPVDADRTDRGLRQLRELGKLKDAGYLTDPEFARIKQQILDSYF
jgi:hypothetical protein